jgi:GntR family galactonate operon transcriptional repressor
MVLATQASSDRLKRNLKEQLVERIGSEIVSGRVQPGDLLPNEDVLLNRYDVSRTVLREALNALSAKGLLDARPKRGTIVRPRAEWSQLDPAILGWSGATRSEDAADRLNELMEVRRIVEPGAAALAARRGTEDDFARMREAYSAMERAATAEEFMEADLAFHIACLNATHNDFLSPIAHAIRTAMMTSLRVTNSDPHENRSVSLPLHRAILDAVLARDPAAAGTAMERHLDDTEERRARAGRVPNV